MGEEGKKEEDKKERRFSQEQYDILKRCSGKKDMTEWNEWRENNRTKQILLQEGNFFGWYLKGADLKAAHMKGAKLVGGELKNAGLSAARLQGASLNGANLEDAHLDHSFLQGANLADTRLEKADLWAAHLEGAIFHRASVDWRTLISLCTIDRKTDFRGVGLDVCRIDSRTKQLLEYNIRRMNWEDWYKEHPRLKWLVKAFWLMSDYGMSTVRVVGVFFILALLFAVVYVNWAYWAPPGIVSNLVVQPEIGEAGWHYFSRALIRPVYFSVVTMTTLGFGDMYANKGSIVGHVLLILQVILGYVLLGALVTRFAVLFTAGGPAGKFAKEKKK